MSYFCTEQLRRNHNKKLSALGFEWIQKYWGLSCVKAQDSVSGGGVVVVGGKAAAATVAAAALAAAVCCLTAEASNVPRRVTPLQSAEVQKKPQWERDTCRRFEEGDK